MAYLLLLGEDGLRESEEGKGEVEECVLVVLVVDLVLGASLVPRQLVQLQAHEPHHGGGGGGDGGDDLPGDALALVLVRRLDLVVGGAQVGAGGDEVHVVVAVVILQDMFNVRVFPFFIGDCPCWTRDARLIHGC